jgi:hypothetical protein
MAARIIDNYQKNMDLVQVLAQHYGINCLFVWQPALLVGDKPKSIEEQTIASTSENELHPGAANLMQATYNGAKKISRPDFLYLGDVFAGETKTMYTDFGQANSEGNRVISEKIFQFAEQHKVHLREAKSNVVNNRPN